MKIHCMYLITAGLLVVTCVSKESSDQGTSGDIKLSDVSALMMGDVQRFEPRQSLQLDEVVQLDGRRRRRRCPPFCGMIPSKGNLNIISI